MVATSDSVGPKLAWSARRVASRTLMVVGAGAGVGLPPVVGGGGAGVSPRPPEPPPQATRATLAQAASRPAESRRLLRPARVRSRSGISWSQMLTGLPERVAG